MRRSRAIQKLLVANRGEIALRVIRAARLLGVRTVAAHAGVDAGAPWTQAADETFPLSGPSRPEGYLDAAALVQAARRTRCDAVHPGYGFLSENAAFAEACEAAGLVFVGPSPETLRLTGDKLGARALARRAGVPVTPGSTGAVETEEALKAVLAETGFPVFLKAAAGGGGKGIRLVGAAREAPAAWDLARAEARKAFGDPTVYVEKRIFPARHVEVQILADARGRVVHLGERECSIQRRHQKLIEESPAAALAPRLRERLCRAAVAIARACRYRGAGTVEFLVDGRGRFYFLEVNARVQVEHPVTEMVTGVDIVAEQIRTAGGAPLSLRQEDVSPRGHAIEARVLAEDPFGDFRPATGLVHALRLPGGPGVRVETALAPGLRVTPHYDSLLAKVLAWGATRGEAAARLALALDEFALDGLPTTAPFLADLLRDPAFLKGSLRTDFLTRWKPPPTPPRAILAASLAASALRLARAARQPASFPPAADTWRAIARQEGIRHGGDTLRHRWQAL